MLSLNRIRLSRRALGQYLKFSTNRLLLKDNREGVNQNEKKQVSVYKKEANFISKSLLAKELKESIVFNDSRLSGLVAVNKPYGLSVLPTETENVSLTCALPELASLLEVPEISVIKSSGKFISGVTLLSTKGKKTTDHVTKCLNRNRTNQKITAKYLAITNGVPKTFGALETVDMALETISTKESIKGGVCKEPVIYKELFSMTKIRQAKKYRKNKDTKPKQIRRVSVVTDLLARSRGNSTALVSIQPNSTDWNFISVYLAHLLAPIIGDSLYSYRVKTVLGKASKVNHQNSPIGYVPNYLPREILGNLGITASDEMHLPLHLHHFRTHLSGFEGNKGLNIYAPLPKYFDQSMKSLKISMDINELESSDSISDYKSVKSKSDG